MSIASRHVSSASDRRLVQSDSVSSDAEFSADAIQLTSTLPAASRRQGGGGRADSAVEARRGASCGISAQEMDEDVPESMGSTVREARRAAVLLQASGGGANGSSLEALQRASRGRVSKDSQFFTDPLEVI